MAKGVFAINDNSAFAYGAAPYLQQQGIPVVGGGYDAFEWTTVSYTEHVLNGLWRVRHEQQPRYLVNPTLLKKAHAKNFAVLGYSVSPSSSGAAANEAVSLKQAGFKVGYLDTSLPFGTVNVTATALQMKAAGVDSMVAEIDGNTELALITAGEQAGIKWKYVVLATGYGSQWLTNPTAVRAVRAFTSGSSRRRWSSTRRRRSRSKPPSRSTRASLGYRTLAGPKDGSLLA